MYEHAPAGGLRDRGSTALLALSLGITVVVFAVQVVGAALSGSLALLADAGHMLTDASGLIVAIIASVVAARPASDRNTYGHQRAEVFGALINAVILIALAAVIAVEGVRRLLTPGWVEVAGGLMFIVACIGLTANLIAMWVLGRAQRRSINVRGAYLEVLGDALGSLAVIIAAIVIMLTGWTRADAIASLFIAAMIVPRAIVLLREVVQVLAEAAPTGTHVAEIREHLLRADGVVAVHDVHVWLLTRGAPVFTAHVEVDSAALMGDGGAALLARLQGCLAEHFDVEHSTFQLEPAGTVSHDELHA